MSRPPGEGPAAQPGAGEVAGSIYLPPWRVDVTRRAGVGRLVPAAALARLAVAALRAADAPGPASIGVILADDAELARLNRSTMGHEGPTDVLSFPLVPSSTFVPHAGTTVRAAPGGARHAGADRGRRVPPGVPAFALPPGQRPHLGDVVVSVERAAVQAREGRGGQTGGRRWSPRDELRLLVVHGVLHVCGWDHARAEERDAMRALENAILAGANGGAGSAGAGVAWPGDRAASTPGGAPAAGSR